MAIKEEKNKKKIIKQLPIVRWLSEIVILWLLCLGNRYFGLLFFYAYIIFFICESVGEASKNLFVQQLRSAVFMIFSSMAYAFPLYFMVKNGKRLDDGLGGLLLLPFYIASLFICFCKAWGKMGFFLGLCFIPMIVGTLFVIILTLP